MAAEVATRISPNAAPRNSPATNETSLDSQRHCCGCVTAVVNKSQEGAVSNVNQSNERADSHVVFHLSKNGPHVGSTRSKAMTTPAEVEQAIVDYEAAKHSPGGTGLLLQRIRMLVSGLKWTSEGLLEKLCKGSLYCQDPVLALHYWHGLSMDHSAWLYNNESLDNAETKQRILGAVESPVGQKEAVELHDAVRQSSDRRVMACASCNELQVPEWGDQGLVKRKFAPILFPTSLTCTRARSKELDAMSALQLRHVMALKRDNTWYNLNPDLVESGSDTVNLCKACAFDSAQKGLFSITNGFDPGRRGSLNPRPASSTTKCIAQVRGFKPAQCTMREKDRKGHVILFPTDAPTEIAKVLPWMNDCLPEVKFYGTPTQWLNGRDKWAHLLRLDPVEVHDYLEVLQAVHQDYKLVHVRNRLETQKEFAQVRVQMTFPTEASLASTGDGVGTGNSVDKMGDKITVTTSAMIQTAAVDEDILGAHDGLLPPAKKGDGHDGPVRVDISSVPETWFVDLRWTLARVFPHLFITGKGIPKTLTHKYWRHLCRHYDGRFQADAEFVTTIFSFMMRQNASFQGSRAKKNNPESLEFMGDLVNSGHLREIVEAAKSSESKRVEVEGILSHFFSVFAKNTPFSPLTMSKARGKIKGGRLRRNTGQQFLTGASKLSGWLACLIVMPP